MNLEIKHEKVRRDDATYEPVYNISFELMGSDVDDIILNAYATHNDPQILAYLENHYGKQLLKEVLNIFNKQHPDRKN